MELKEFERYLELLKLKEEYYKSCKTNDKNVDPFPYYDDLDDLKMKIQRFLFNNQSAVENTICRLKTTLEKLGSNYSGYGSFSDPNKTLNEVKVVREILALLDTYDWKVKYYYSPISSEMSVWEENSEGQKRNIKTLKVVE